MWETHQGSQPPPNPTSLFFLEVERAAVQKNFQGFCDLLWIEGRSLGWIVGGPGICLPVNVEADVCWQFCSGGKKIWEKKLNLACGWLGFILHLSRWSSPHRPLEDAQLSAVPVLQGGVFTRPGPGTVGVSCRLERILGPASGPLLPQEVTLRLHSEGGDRESPTLQDWDFTNPSEGFSFVVVSVSEGHCRGESWQIPGLRGLYFLHPNCQTPPNTYVLMGAIDWNIWNQNSRKSRTDVFPDQGKPSVTEPLGLPAPCQCCCGWGWLLLN